MWVQEPIYYCEKSFHTKQCHHTQSFPHQGRGTFYPYNDFSMVSYSLWNLLTIGINSSVALLPIECLMEILVNVSTEVSFPAWVLLVGIPLMIWTILRNTFSNWEKCILQFGEIHFTIWRNIFWNLEKYILQFGEIYLVIWGNTYCNLEKYTLQFSKIHFEIWRNTF